MAKIEYCGTCPDADGRFGRFGGQFVPEILKPALNKLAAEYLKAKDDPEFWEELNDLRKNYTGRPTPLYHAKRLSEKYGCKIYLKREDLLHGGAHKINNTLGQVILAKRMGAKELIAETGAGQHGVATAIAGAMAGIKTKIFMGRVDCERQSFNVLRMRMLGAEVIPVDLGSKTLKDAVDAAIMYWAEHYETTFYLLGSAVGPHPYPMMVRDFQSVISKESKEQMMEQEGRLPDAIVACVGGGSNAMGSFYNYIEEESVELIAVEAAGLGADTDKHALALGKGTEANYQGAYQFLLQDENGEVHDSYSIAAGLDYPGVGPELCHLKESHRMMNTSATDKEAIQALQELSRLEGIIPAVESSHAVAFALKLAKTKSKEDIILVNLSGQGSKDVERIPLE